MRSIVSTLIRPLAVVAILILFAGPLRADPLVEFGLGGGPGFIAVPDLNPIPLGTVGADGTLTVVLRNTSMLRFLDFHFTSGTQSALWMGSGLPFFSIVNPGPNFELIHFFEGQGTGIAPTTTFTVTFSGFTPGSMITGQATIPEPTTMLLLGTGLAGIAMKMRKRLRKTKREGVP